MKQGKNGFTIIGLAVTLAIVSIIGSAAATATFQVVKSAGRNENHMTAVRQVQNAGYWISRDTQMAESVVVDNLEAPNFLVLSWTEENSGDNYQVVYTLENMAEGELKELRRNRSINGGASTATLVAQYIDPDAQKTNCEFTNGILTLTVTATDSDASLPQSETRTYTVAPRPG